MSLPPGRPKEGSLPLGGKARSAKGAVICADASADVAIATPILSRLPDGRWGPLEIAFWLIPAAAFFLLPDYRVLGSQILITGLFALSLDLILGYAGIVSLGHAAFFGIGAYTAGLLAKNGFNEPISGLLIAAIVAALAGYLVSFLVVRGSDLTRLMVTLGVGLMLWEAANKAAFVTGGVDGLSFTAGKLFGVFAFDIRGRTAFLYSLAVMFVVFLIVRRIVNSPFGLSLRGIREGGPRMPAIGAPVGRRLRTIFTIAAAVAGIAGALLAQTTQFVGIDTLGFPRSAELLIMLVLGGTGRLYGGFVGAAIFMIAQDYLSGIDPVYWEFWIGFFLVVIVLFARGGILGGLDALHKRWATRRLSAGPPQGKPPAPSGGGERSELRGP
jgi:branched-chain amino acid transport system permease protein